MDSLILMEKNVDFRGVWHTGTHVTEGQIKSIYEEYFSKPALPCKFKLTRSGLLLERLSAHDDKGVGKMDEIPFQKIQDVLYNQQNISCFLVVYVDAINKLCIIACSSNKPEDIVAIHGAYVNEKQRRNHQNGHANWTLQSKVIQNKGVLPNYSLQSRLAQRASLRSASNSSSYTSYLDSEVVDDNVFHSNHEFAIRPDHYKVEREPVHLNNETFPDAYNVGIQTFPGDIDPDRVSITSELSTQTMKDDSLADEMNALHLHGTISAEEYLIRENLPLAKNRKTVAFQATPTFINNQSSVTHENGVSGTVHDETDAGKPGHVVRPDDYDRRSISVQTPTGQMSGQRNRYTKNPLTLTGSNAYKERMVVMRKKSSTSGSESGGSAITPNQQFPGHGSFVSTANQQFPGHGSFVSTARPTVPSTPNRPLTRTMSAGRTTVQRPIEQVYQHRSGSQRRKVVIIPSNKLYQ